MVKVKIFLNNQGCPGELEKSINDWIKEKNLGILNIKNIQLSTAYDAGLDEYVLTILLLYEDFRR